MRNEQKRNKLFHDFYKAEQALIKQRNEEFPIGTKVMFYDTLETTVIGGSLYAHQVNTPRGHVGWFNLKKIEEKTNG